jgi:hypothetical protein
LTSLGKKGIEAAVKLSEGKKTALESVQVGRLKFVKIGLDCGGIIKRPRERMRVNEANPW